MVMMMIVRDFYRKKFYDFDEITGKFSFIKEEKSNFEDVVGQFHGLLIGGKVVIYDEGGRRYIVQHKNRRVFLGENGLDISLKVFGPLYWVRVNSKSVNFFWAEINFREFFCRIVDPTYDWLDADGSSFLSTVKYTYEYSQETSREGKKDEAD